MKEIIDLSEKTITLERHDFLKSEGSIDRNIYYIVTGSLRVFVMADDKEQILRFGYKGNILVSLDSYLTGNTSKICIQAIKKSVIKVVTRKQMDQFLAIPANTITWIKILENLVVQQLEREMDVLTTSPKERYERVLTRSPQLFQEIPHRHIANYLRMSAETLSRLKKS